MEKMDIHSEKLEKNLLQTAEIQIDKELKKKIVSIALKYANLVEKRIEKEEELDKENQYGIEDSIRMLGHITMTLERINRMESGIDFAIDPYREGNISNVPIHKS